jgi:hypothetical protein
VEHDNADSCDTKDHDDYSDQEETPTALALIRLLDQGLRISEEWRRTVASAWSVSSLLA